MELQNVYVYFKNRSLADENYHASTEANEMMLKDTRQVFGTQLSAAIPWCVATLRTVELAVCSGRFSTCPWNCKDFLTSHQRGSAANIFKNISQSHSAQSCV